MAICGVSIKQLKALPDERGRLMEILRSDDTMYKGFGQVYITTGYPGVIKAWHYHKRQYDNLAAVHGMIKLVIYDGREDSMTRGEIQELFLGEHNPLLVQIPPMVYHGFKTISLDEAIVVNVPSEPYNPGAPDEFRLDVYTPEIPYEWARKDR